MKVYELIEQLMLAPAGQEVEVFFMGEEGLVSLGENNELVAFEPEMYADEIYAVSPYDNDNVLKLYTKDAWNFVYGDFEEELCEACKVHENEEVAPEVAPKEEPVE